ncbi:MAG: hypothetical protein JNL08_19415 [Planctomycetes bacterium]|nr:hypothetical protein [Planctomycetota bacterium]
MRPRLLLACSCVLPACAGPALHLHGVDAARVFVDGREVAAPRAAEDDPSAGPEPDPGPPVDPTVARVPFRYYGTTRWHALPRDHSDGEPDWAHQPAAATVALPAPASPWLFPLDFPLELAQWAFGRGDTHVEIDLPATPAMRTPPPEVPLPGLTELAGRAAAARVQR